MSHQTLNATNARIRASAVPDSALQLQLKPGTFVIRESHGTYAPAKAAPAYQLDPQHPARIVFEQSVLAFLESIDKPSSDPDQADDYRVFSRMREAASDLQAAKRVAILDGPRTAAIAAAKRQQAQQDAQAKTVGDVAAAVGVTPSQLAKFGPDAVAKVYAIVKPKQTPPTAEQLAELFKRPEFNQVEQDTAVGVVGQGVPGVRILLANEPEPVIGYQPAGTYRLSSTCSNVQTLAGGTNQVGNDLGAIQDIAQDGPKS